MMNRLLIIFSIWLMVVMQCDDLLIDDSTQQKYYFETEYGNSAFGYHLSGWYINDDGKVFSYKYHNSEDRWRPADYDKPTGSELQEKYSHLASFIFKIPSDTLNKYIHLINTAMLGSYSDTVCQGYDMGNHRSLCYTYDQDINTYSRYVLITTGNYFYEMITPEAQILINWLERINTSIYNLPD